MTNSKKPNKGSGGSGGEGGSLSIANRSVDLILVVWWITFLFTVTFTDLHNFLASYLGVPLTALKDMDLPYPPKVLTEIYFKVRKPSNTFTFFEDHQNTPKKNLLDIFFAVG